MIAHCSQLHAVPDPLPDEVAVLVEPLACAVHAVRRVPVSIGPVALLPLSPVLTIAHSAYADILTGGSKSSGSGQT